MNFGIDSSVESKRKNEESLGINRYLFSKSLLNLHPKDIPPHIAKHH
jgi:hypothetical protein